MAEDALTPLMPPLADLPEELRNLRDDRWRRFVWGYVFNGANGAAAARAAGFSDLSEAAKVRAHALLQRDEIQAAIKALMTRHLFSLGPKAALRLDELLDNPKHPQHAKAIDMALDRAGHGQKSTLDVNLNGSVTVNHTDAAIEDLRRLLVLKVPREELVQIFGFSGLDRYEKMLAIADRRVSRETGPVIEHEAKP
jgi:hypothetical protein